MLKIAVGGAACWMSCAIATAQGPWSVVSLHPGSNDYSRLYAIGSGSQGGVVSPTKQYTLASLWNDSASSWINLHPAGAKSSEVFAIDGPMQIGGASFGVGSVEGGLWTGSAASWTSLHPPSQLNSICFGGRGGVQVGWTETITGSHHAAMWMGSKETWIDLHPAIALESGASGGGDGEQVGYALIPYKPFGNYYHASLWKGTAQSWVDLHPPNIKYMDTFVYAAHNGQQVGSFYNVGTDMACMWDGTAASFRLLVPLYTRSMARGVYNGIQVGWVDGLPGGPCLWRGSADSIEFLPDSDTGELKGMSAYSIYQDDKKTYIGGIGFNVVTNRAEALLWTRLNAAPCKPDCDASGELDIDDFICFQTTYAIGDMAADCDGDGQLLIDDFICFQTAYAIGC